ncbi:MAG: toll/interleukin-1 receptor domain-containing protein, partial [Thiotrichales bacterium]
MEVEPRITVYLSYRRLKVEKTERDALFDACRENGINLVFDEIGTKDGDSIVEFMRHVTEARFVIAFLTPDYFFTPYTLFELLRVAEDTNAKARIQFATVRAGAGIDNLFKSEFKESWYAGSPTAEIRQTQLRLAELLQCEIPNGRGTHEVMKPIYDEIGERIERAWDGLVAPALQNLSSPPTDDDSLRSHFDGVVAKLRETAEQVASDYQTELEKTVTEGLSSLLSETTVLAKALIAKLWMASTTDSEALAMRLVGEGAYDSISALGDVFERLEHRGFHRRGGDAWLDLCYSAKQICGWLLLLSVDG